MAALTSAFEQTSAGKGVGFSQSFGASGSQSRAVDSGQPADIVAFSTTPDMTRLVKDGIVSSNWDANPAKGMSSDSVVVFVVRKGNPKHITSWDDLIKPGVDVITPNPSTSGSARWNILAGYGAQLKEGKSPAQALDYVKTLLTKNVSVQDSSASAALQHVHLRQGRRPARLRVRRDRRPESRRLDPVHRPQADAADRDADRRDDQEQARFAAQAFLNWQWSAAGQKIWAQQGYRPVMPSVAEQFASKFPTPPQLFTINYLGGWTKVKGTFFDPSLWLDHQDRAEAGVPTASS